MEDQIPRPEQVTNDRANGGLVDQSVDTGTNTLSVGGSLIANLNTQGGLDVIQDQYGEWVVDCHLPDPGTPTQGVEAGYMANAWVRIKHPDYDHLRSMLDSVGQTVQVRAR